VGNDLAIDQLFVNGQRQNMARYPNFDAHSQYFNGFSKDAFAAERVKTWNNPNGGFIHAMHRTFRTSPRQYLVIFMGFDSLLIVGGRRDPEEFEELAVKRRECRGDRFAFARSRGRQRVTG
jgi:hypothetical protein